MKKGSKMTTEQIKRLSKAHLGQVAWNKGTTYKLKQTHSVEHCKKLWENRRKNGNDKPSLESKNKMSESRSKGIKEGKIKTWNEGLKLPYKSRPSIY